MRAVTMRMAMLMLATTALAAGCYGPKLRNFGFSCDPQAIKPCPDGSFCNQGFCDDGSGGMPPGTGGNGDADMAMANGGGGGGGGGGSAGGGGGGGGGNVKDMAMTVHDMAMSSPDMAKPADMVVVSSCAHDECTTGVKLTKTCSSCASQVCATGNDTFCCSTQWDSTCVSEVNMYCTTKTCP
jgi:hypothetical protein